MIVASYLELHTTLVAWLLYGVVWEILLGTGLLILPVLWLLLRRTAESAGTEDSGRHADSVDHLKSTAMALFVLLFCMTPVWTVAPSDVKFRPPAHPDGTPQAEVHAESDPTTYRDAFGSATAPVRIPTWWRLLHSISQGITRAVIESLPTHADLREASLLFGSRNIADPALGQEYTDFVLGCHLPAKRNYQRLRQANRVPAADGDAQLDWAGSPYLRQMPGGYAACCSSRPCPDADAEICVAAPVPLTLQKSAAFAAMVGGNTCGHWWEHLRPRLLAHARADADVGNRLQAALGMGLGVPGTREQEDILIRKMLENTAVRGVPLSGTATAAEASGFFGRIGQLISQGFSTAGLAVSAGLTHIALGVIKQALPILIAMMSLFLVLFIPFGLVFSSYRMGTVIRLSFWMFSLIFLHALLAVVAWVDHWLIVSLFGNQEAWNWVAGGDTLLGDAQKKMLINILLALNYTAVPLLWLTVMSAIGAGAADGANRMISESGSRLGQSATRGLGALKGLAPGRGGSAARPVTQTAGAGTGKTYRF